MNDTELVASAMRRRDDYIKSCLGSSRTNRGRSITIAIFIFVVAMTGAVLF